MTSFFDIHNKLFNTTSMEVKNTNWGEPQEDLNFNNIVPPVIKRQHIIFSSSDEEDLFDMEEDYGKKTTIFNKKELAETNPSDKDTDSEVEAITNQLELQEDFERFSEESLPEIEDLTHLSPPKPVIRHINEEKYSLPLKMLKHFKLQYIHVETKWDWDMAWKSGQGGVTGAWVYAIFKIQDDIEEKLKPKKVIIYVPKYYAARAYDVGRRSFDDDAEFQQFLKSPQWWKDVSDFPGTRDV